MVKSVFFEVLYFCFVFYYNILNISVLGGMAEWFKAAVLKTVDEKLSESSNPSSSNFY